jgi:hypothetical protein
VRIWRSPYVLTHEDAVRLCAVLKRWYDGRRTLRELERRHRVWPRVVKAAAAAGIVRIEKHKPHTGRPSYIAVLEPDSVNKCKAAKLPYRFERLLSLSIREESFLQHYLCRRGLRGFFPGGSAADAYRKVYGRHRPLTLGSIRSAGARLARQPWMKAAFFLDRRMSHHGGRLHWPADLRSAARQWLQLVRMVNRYGDWPADVCRVIQQARTYPDAVDGLRRLDRFRSSVDVLEQTGEASPTQRTSDKDPRVRLKSVRKVSE